jgi:hypothetical protein
MNKYFTRRIFHIISLLTMLGMAAAPLTVSAHNAGSGGIKTQSSAKVEATPGLVGFIEQVKNGSADQITGIYIKNILSFPVIQQPGDQPAFVSQDADVITQFLQASAYGSTGFLAHNSLAGRLFPEITSGDVIFVIFGDGHYIQYQVSQIRRFQALQATNPYSSFVDLSSGQTLSVQEIFNETYGVRGQVVLQTCIARQGIDSWGRLFIIALPYTPPSFEAAFPLFLAPWE